MRSKLFLFAAASAALFLTAQAAFDMGNGVKVVPNVVTSVDFNDNLFLSSNNEQSETVVRLSPGILVGVGEGAVSNATFSYNEEFQFYSDESDLNTSLSLVDFASHYDDSKMKLEVIAWFHEANQATRDIAALATLVKRQLTHGSISDEVEWTDKTSAKIGFAYDKTDYSSSAYKDWKWIEVPAQYFYQVLPKLDASVGFRYRKNGIGGTGVDSDDLFYNVGVRGELTPKLTGEIQVGYNELRPDVGATQHALGLKANLTLALTPKSNLYLDASNQFGYSAGGEAYKNTGIAARFDTAMTTNFLLLGSAFWNTYDYSTTSQKDDYMGGQIAGRYTFNEHAALTASYTYADNDSNLTSASFKNSIVSLSATFRY